VVAVSDAAQAKALADLPKRFDALVADVDLPNLSGIELAMSLLEHDPDIGVVLLSGYTADRLHLEGVIACGATFAPKPITSARLLAAVRDATASRAERGSS
jgi:FixJ family two-component response regulator